MSTWWQADERSAATGRTRAASPAGDRAAAGDAQSAMLALQRGAGNQAVTRWIAETGGGPGARGRDVAAEPSADRGGLETADGDDDLETLAPEDIEALATELEAPQAHSGEAKQPSGEATPEAGAAQRSVSRLPRASGRLLRTPPKKKKSGEGGSPPADVAVGLDIVEWKTYRKRVKTEAIAGLVYAALTGSTDPRTQDEHVVVVPLPTLTARPDLVAVRTSLNLITQHMRRHAGKLRGVKVRKGTGLTAKGRGAWRAKLTEGTGETAATKWVMEHEAGFELIFGFGSGKGIDQVWARKAGGTVQEYLLVEAKGPGQKLTGDEMTLEWIRRGVRWLDEPHRSAILGALGPGKVGGSAGVPIVRGLVLRAQWIKALGAVKLGVPSPNANGRYN